MDFASGWADFGDIDLDGMGSTIPVISAGWSSSSSSPEKIVHGGLSSTLGAFRGVEDVVDLDSQRGPQAEVERHATERPGLGSQSTPGTIQ